MTTTTRTIEQVFQLRLRAAELRVGERVLAVVKAQEAVEQGWGEATSEREELAKMVDARRLADEALELAKRDVAAVNGEGELAVYEPDSGFALRRYAAVLMVDNAELDAVEALRQARADNQVRFEDHMFRTYGPDWDKED